MFIHEFLNRLNAAKWTIVALASMFFIVALLAIFLIPRKQMVTMEIRPAPTLNNVEYTALNRHVVHLATRLDTKTGLESNSSGHQLSFYTINNGSLVVTLIERLRLLDVFEKELSERAVVRKTGESEAEYRNRLIKKLQSIKIFPFEDSANWAVTYADNLEPRQIVDILRASLMFTVEIVRNDYRRRIGALITQSEKLEIERLADIEAQIGLETKLYKDRLSLEIRTLEEQAKIARSLGIEKNTLEALPVGNVATIFSNGTGSRPLFLRGYIALEREIELKSNRKEADLYAPALIELRDARRKLIADQLVELTKSELQSSPLYSGEFRPAVINETSFVYHRPKYLLEMIVAAFMSVLLALALVAGTIAARVELERTKVEA